jgi:uncharacterized membrane protein YqhA
MSERTTIVPIIGVHFLESAVTCKSNLSSATMLALPLPHKAVVALGIETVTYPAADVTVRVYLVVVLES